MYAAEAKRLIGDAAVRRAGAPGGGPPMFLYLAAQSIHTPLEAPDECVQSPSAISRCQDQPTHLI